MKSAILGISAYYHDSAAVLLKDGAIAAAAQEERFVRVKHYAGFPANAVRFVLAEAGVALNDVDAIAFYDKPFLKFERLLETYHTVAPAGVSQFVASMPLWIKEKLFTRQLLRQELEKIGGRRARPEVPPLVFPEHHLSHAASAFYPSPFDEAAILTVDGVGEWATTTIGRGGLETITILRQLDFPHSLGLLYSAFTRYCGFRVNSGEYKLMGLAPYGHADGPRCASFKRKIFDEMVDIRDDGSFLLNMSYFPYMVSLSMCDDSRWERLFGVKRRSPEGPVEQPHMDLAAAIQQVCEEIVLRLGRTARGLTGSDRLALAGGVALNCVANAKLRASGLFKRIWVQPAAGDAGGALGAAYAALVIGKKGNLPVKDGRSDLMAGAYLGPLFSSDAIAAALRGLGLRSRKLDSPEELCSRTAALLDEGKVVGWFQGRMEWGPRALGNRSILGDPRNPDMQQRLNLRIKRREGFRPFAPAVLAEDAPAFFEMQEDSPYMLFTVPVAHGRRKTLPVDFNGRSLYDRLYWPRSDIPAVTHLDFSARVQTVRRETNPLFYGLLAAFKKLTGYGVLVNTSFNVRGEPIVCTPEDACRCFLNTDMDCLAIGDFLVEMKNH